MRVCEIANSLGWDVVNNKIENQIEAKEPFDIYVQEYFLTTTASDPHCRVFASAEIANELAKAFSWRIHEVLPRTRTYILIAEGTAAKIMSHLKVVRTA